MPFSRVALGLLLSIWVAAAIGLAQAPGGRQGGRGDRQPDSPLPNIREYKPRSTLVVPEHLVPRAKFPVVDLHGHPPPLTSPEAVERVVSAMDPLNLRIMAVTGNPGRIPHEQMRQDLEVLAASKHKDRFAIFANIDFRNVGPGFGKLTAEQLEADVKSGAAGLGEIMKDFGLTARKTDGSRLKLDDPELDPIWSTAARLSIPVIMHVGDPGPFWEPFNYTNERYLEMALFPNRRCPQERCPPFEELMAERDRLFKKHPKTKFVAAHFGWHANDLGRLGRMLQEMPNVYVETGAILYELGRQPRFAHDFFVKHQDRVLFGKDTFAPDEYPYFWRTFETADEYFDYYRDYHAFWKLNGLALPDAVLRKLYFENALKLVPGLSRAGFPR
jgi:predicted TIM-barrel fold metal-dependent hydrolase